MCVTILSCSAISVIFLHNDTGAPLDYNIKVVGSYKDVKQDESRGTLAPGEVKEAYHYFHDVIQSVRVEVLQNGAGRSAEFRGATLPPSLTHGSSGGNWSHIKVTKTGFTIGAGSGMWFEDFQHRMGFMLIPCAGLCVLILLVGVAKVLKSRKQMEA